MIIFQTFQLVLELQRRRDRTAQSVSEYTPRWHFRCDLRPCLRSQLRQHPSLSPGHSRAISCVSASPTCKPRPTVTNTQNDGCTLVPTSRRAVANLNDTRGAGGEGGGGKCRNRKYSLLESDCTTRGRCARFVPPSAGAPAPPRPWNATLSTTSGPPPLACPSRLSCALGTTCGCESPPRTGGC